MSLIPAAAAGPGGFGSIRTVQDPAALARDLRRSPPHGPSAQAGITLAPAKPVDLLARSFPHFSGSYTVGGVTYPYTMVGFPPSSGETANIKSVIIPVRLDFQDDAGNVVSFLPDRAVANILASPIYQNARFPNGVGQFGDMLQRATFWRKMDRERHWHVRMQTPRVLRTMTVKVAATEGTVLQLGSDPGSPLFGVVDFDTLYNALQAATVRLGLDPDVVPVFVTYNSCNQALGYHDAFQETQGRSTFLRTLIYTSWLETELFGDLLADVSTLNHEVAEWLNDPYVNNEAPEWAFPPYNTVCGDNPLLEVGDPQGNGPDYDQFPTVPIPLNGFVYHLQDVVMLPWFAGEVPSSALNGWYDFPDTHQITTPFAPCPP